MPPHGGIFIVRRFAPPPDFRVKLGMKNDFYTYAYLRENGTPYYIGKGKGRRAFRSHGKVKVPPKDRILFLKINLTEEEAFKHEIYMIAVFGRKDLGKGILLNFSDGGEGPSGNILSAETKQKMSEAKKGVKFSDEHRKNISRSKVGKPRDLPWCVAARRRPILGTRPDGEVFYFDSAADASRERNVASTHISACCRGKRKSAGEWTWIYFE